MTALLAKFAAARSWLTLIAVACAAAFLYWKFATVQRDRDALLRFAETACATSGAPFAASKDHKRGELCGARVLQLAAFERDAIKASNEALTGALQEHNRKSEADASAAAHDAAVAVAAARRMEQAENAVQDDDRVGRDWFDALNGLGGLRAPGR